MATARRKAACAPPCAADLRASAVAVSSPAPHLAIMSKPEALSKTGQLPDHARQSRVIDRFLEDLEEKAEAAR